MSRKPRSALPRSRQRETFSWTRRRRRSWMSRRVHRRLPEAVVSPPAALGSRRIFGNSSATSPSRSTAALSEARRPCSSSRRLPCGRCGSATPARPSAAASARTSTRACAAIGCATMTQATVSDAPTSSATASVTPSWCRTRPSRTGAGASTSRRSTRACRRTHAPAARRARAKPSTRRGCATAATRPASTRRPS